MHDNQVVGGDEWQGIAHAGGARDAITSVAWSSDGKRFGEWECRQNNQAVGCGERQGTACAERAPGIFVSAVAWSSDGKTLASASWDHTIKLWDVASGKVRTLMGTVFMFIRWRGVRMARRSPVPVGITPSSYGMSPVGKNCARCNANLQQLFSRL